ncbi:MAG: hypothetical protein HY811_01775 [Planctomycetes bacterium]|nr:hypothetical protein [Planctomycetota bacterium]
MIKLRNSSGVPTQSGRIVYWLTAFLFSLSFSAFSDDYELDARASIDESEGAYNITVNIKSSLPENSVLEISVCYIKKYLIPSSLRKHDQPEYETEPAELITETTSLNNGACVLKAGNYKRRPYVGDYRVKIIFNPNSQPAGVKQKLPADIKPIEKEISFAYGNPDELEGQKKNIRKEIYIELEEIKKLYDSLRAKTASYAKEGKFDQADWEKWQSDLKVKTDEIKKANESRLEGWVYRLETVGKHSIDAMCAELIKLAADYEKLALSTADMQKVSAGFVPFTDSFDMTFDYELQRLGFGSIPDKPLVKSAVEETEKNLGLIEVLFSEADKEKWAKLSAEYKDAIQKEIFKLSNATSEYIYATYLAPFTQDFVKYIETCSKAVEESVEDKMVNQLSAKLKKTIKELKETLEIE